MEDGNSKVELEKTKLRLGLPGGEGGGGEAQEGNNKETTNANKKRSYAQSSMVDLKLKLGPNETTSAMGYLLQKQKDLLLNSTQRVPKSPPAKAQVVGWPPVQSFRNKIIGGGVQNSKLDQTTNDDKVCERSGGAAVVLVKVSMHGTPYLRKVDLNMYKNYRELSDALANMFHSFASAVVGGCESRGVIGSFLKESNLVDILNSSQYVPTYEDKHGDWLLVGDVPWEMFLESCKRLRIMKGAEATKLAPRALEKFKNLQMKLNI